MRLADLKIDEDFKNLLPELDAETYTALEKDISANGMIDPIVVWKGYIADGHNRYSICKAHRVADVETKELHKETKSEVMQWIVDHQFGKRNLKKSEQVMLLAKVEEQVAREAKERQLASLKQNTVTANLPQRKSEEKRNDTTAGQMAKKIGVSEKTYRAMKTVVQKGTPEQIARMDKGGRGNSASAIEEEIKEGIPDGYRKCRKCGEVKSLDEFWKRDKSSDIYETICICCRNKKKEEGANKDVGATVLMENQQGTRKCSKCGQIKPISFFSINHGCKTFVCKKCDAERKKEAEKSKVMPDTLNPDIPVVITDDVTISEFENILANTINSFEIALEINKEHITKDVKSAINKLLDEHIKKMERIKEGL